MEIKVKKVPADRIKKKPTDESKLGFGQIFSDHFFTMKYKTGQGWYDPQVEPYHTLQIDPAAMSLHYGQLIFEGLKAYRGADGSVYLFRPWENVRRMNESAIRLCIPPLDEKLAVEALKQIVIVEKDWIPRGVGTSMYIRPTMMATDQRRRVGRSATASRSPGLPRRASGSAVSGRQGDRSRHRIDTR